jgi:prepilin-type N-terminal cleavage/methylation domain-containing protein
LLSAPLVLLKIMVMNIPKRSSRAAFTLIELLVVISIIAILASLAVPAVTGALTRGQLTGSLNNARQLQIATQTMALDAFTSGEGPGWPGDNDDSWQDFCQNLVDGKYLTESDLRKMATAPGVQIPPNQFPPSKSGLQVYSVKENDPGDSIFVSTYNWTGFSELAQDSVPFGDKGFVIFRKAGDGNVYQARQAQSESIGNSKLAAGIAPAP